MKISRVTSSNQRANTLICYTFHKMTKQEGGLGRCDGCKTTHQMIWNKMTRIMLHWLVSKWVVFLLVTLKWAKVTKCYEHVRHNRGYDTVFARASLNGFWGNVSIQVIVIEETWIQLEWQQSNQFLSMNNQIMYTCVTKEITHTNAECHWDKWYTATTNHNTES